MRPPFTPARVAVGAAVAVVAALAATYLLFFTPDSPPPLTLGDAPITTPSATAAPGAPTTPARTGVAGVWKVASGSEAGYRVREKLAALPASSDAVGRTTAVTGQVTVESSGGAVEASQARFEADLTKLTSDEARRDARIRTMGLESDRFPTATFVSTEPVRVGSVPAEGQVVKVDVVGDLTLHGVTRRVTIPTDARFSPGRIELAGSLKFPMSDFSITPPSIGGFVTVEPDATMEFRLVLQPA